ncbi:hypothetical protein Bbelb_270540 [Branchiostoma belcheri]|nr:hypothetical protein Bbelb_270540 [Branchiostoma belcheri]
MTALSSTVLDGDKLCPVLYPLRHRTGQTRFWTQLTPEKESQATAWSHSATPKRAEKQPSVSLEAGDSGKLAELMNMNFDLRRKIYGDAAVGRKNLQMVDIARQVPEGGRDGSVAGVASCRDVTRPGSREEKWRTRWSVVKIEQFTFRVWTAIWTSSGQFVLRPEPVSNIKPRRTAPLPHDRDSHGFTEKPIQCNRRKNLPVQEVNMQLTCGYQKADHTGPPQSPG